MQPTEGDITSKLDRVYADCQYSCPILLSVESLDQLVDRLDCVVIFFVTNATHFAISGSRISATILILNLMFYVKFMLHFSCTSVVMSHESYALCLVANVYSPYPCLSTPVWSAERKGCRHGKSFWCHVTSLQVGGGMKRSHLWLCCKFENLKLKHQLSSAKFCYQMKWHVMSLSGFVLPSS